VSLNIWISVGLSKKTKNLKFGLLRFLGFCKNLKTYIFKNPFLQPRGSKMQNGRFRQKMSFTCRKSDTIVLSLCEYCQQQSCKGNLTETDRSSSKTPIFNQYSLVEPQP